MSNEDNVSAAESLIVNDKNTLIELNKKLDREIISFGYLKESIEIIAYIYIRCKVFFSSILSIILRLCVLSPSETDLQETQQQIRHTIDFDLYDIHETYHILDKYDIVYATVAELKYPMILLNV
ncbi:unnamed protein product [Rotaria sp. Silwood1]|nr:unnamed protein product [Rotaria sp. Silwood1]CAF1558857.1 unnamed protein product [Rotaria sp. Silwood1]CAF3680228.1 unnamed protein product [Rotaria sp. Silwood1]